jgi:Domain of unknown function (DUF4266)
MRRPVVARLLLAVLAAGALGGCASVAPWQRGYLARPDMGLEPGAPARALDKTYASKEAASGGGAVGGGGCGCN